MKSTVIRTAEQEEYLHPRHDRFFLRDVVTAELNPALSLHRGRIEAGGRSAPTSMKGRRKLSTSSAAKPSAPSMVWNTASAPAVAS